MQVISKQELIQENNEDEVMIHTKRNSLYKLLTHTVVNDTICGKGYLKSYSDSHFAEPFKGRIAMDDVHLIEQDKINWFETSALVIGAGLFIWALVTVAEFGNAFN
jgi:hypothetical protein